MIVITHNGCTYPVVIECRTGRQPAGPWIAHLAEAAEHDGAQGWEIHDDVVTPGHAQSLDEAVGRLAANISAAFPADAPTGVDLTDEQVERLAEMLAVDAAGQ